VATFGPREVVMIKSSENGGSGRLEAEAALDHLRTSICTVHLLRTPLRHDVNSVMKRLNDSFCYTKR
jgi:hypothetical protein